MGLKTTSNLTSDEVLQIIANAQVAESCRDIKSLQSFLQLIWKDFEDFPDYSQFETSIEAELLRLSGSYLTLYGGSKNLKNYHLRAKDILTSAIIIFESLDLREKAIESKIWLGYAFAQCGEINEYKLIYDELEIELKDEPISRNSLLVKNNRLAVFIYLKEFKKALLFVNDVLGYFRNSSDARLQALFYINAGIIFNENALYKSALDCFNDASAALDGLNIPDMEARNFNEIALLYKSEEKFTEAHLASNSAIKIALKIENYRLAACFLDTSASIFLAEGQYNESLKVINAALDYFYEGEDAYSLVEALWIKTLSLLRLSRRHEAFDSYSELRQIARQKIGESVCKKFEELFEDEIYILQGLPLDAEIEALEEHLTRRALIKSGGKIGKAAQLLQLENYQALQYNLLYKFPKMKEELNIKVRQSPNSKTKKEVNKKTKSKNVVTNSDLPKAVIKAEKIERQNYDEILIKQIAPIDLPAKIFSYPDSSISPKHVETFYFKDSLMQMFGIYEGSVIAVSQTDNPIPGQLALVFIESEKQYRIGKVRFAEWEQIYFLEDPFGEPIPLDENNVVGSVIGYCPFSKVKNDFVEFQALEY